MSKKIKTQNVPQADLPGGVKIVDREDVVDEKGKTLMHKGNLQGSASNLRTELLGIFAQILAEPKGKALMLGLLREDEEGNDAAEYMIVALQPGLEDSALIDLMDGILTKLVQSGVYRLPTIQ